MIPNIIILSDRAYDLALKIKQEIGGTIQGLEGRCSKSDSTFSDVRAHLQSCFKGGEPLVAIMASGAIIRLLADVLADKHSEPPVLAIAEDSSSVVPLLGGHHGANELAKQLAEVFSRMPQLQRRVICDLASRLIIHRKVGRW
jgi:cobalt-precorrin 5A hydrolase/precorrin-3B C17-methyltransferase